MENNSIIVNGGGPTSVINYTNIGIAEVLSQANDGRTFFARNGIESLVNGGLYEVSFTNELLAHLTTTPSSWLGSSRYKLKRGDERLVIERCKELDVKRLFLVGGDDTLQTANTISQYMGAEGVRYPIVMGCPKTIDNDLPDKVVNDSPDKVKNGTLNSILEGGVIYKNGYVQCFDFCPGFPSAATFVANKVLGLGVEAHALRRHYIVEVMGRDVGWLTAAAKVAEKFGYGPHCIIPPEVPFDMEKFKDLVLFRNELTRWGIYVVSEGIKDIETGEVILKTGSIADDFREETFRGVSYHLQSVIDAVAKKKDIKIDVRAIKFGELQRIATEHNTEVDKDVAKKVGIDAARWALKEKSGYVVTIKREIASDGSPYWITGLVKTEQVAGKKRGLDDRYISNPVELGEFEGRKVTTLTIDKSYLGYLNPLLGGIRPVARPIEEIGRRVS